METSKMNKASRLSKSNTADNGIRVHNMNPVIKLTPEGILLFANSTGIDFLEMLADQVKEPALKYLLTNCPEILDPHCSLDLCCKIHEMNYYFSVVAFKEAGYVGLYGYRLVHLHSRDSLVA